MEVDGKDFFHAYLRASPYILILNANETETPCEKKSGLNQPVTFICKNPNMSC